MNDTIFMCSPDHFTVSYEINPWMKGNIDRSSIEIATKQWQNLRDRIKSVAYVRTIKQHKNLPDQVFTANAGLVYKDKAVLSRFANKERQGEESKFQKFFTDHRFKTLVMPITVAFEGAGDALWDRHQRNILWMGYGHRTDIDAADIIGDFMNVSVHPLNLVNDRFYHLDTCFCPLNNGEVMYYPGAFDKRSLTDINEVHTKDRLIEVTEDEAHDFACNAVNVGDHIFMNRVSYRLREVLGERGYTVIETPLSEFMKAGGAAKCLTLKLNET